MDGEDSVLQSDSEESDIELETFALFPVSIRNSETWQNYLST